MILLFQFVFCPKSWKKFTLWSGSLGFSVALFNSVAFPVHSQDNSFGETFLPLQAYIELKGSLGVYTF